MSAEDTRFVQYFELDSQNPYAPKKPEFKITYDTDSVITEYTTSTYKKVVLIIPRSFLNELNIVPIASMPITFLNNNVFMRYLVLGVWSDKLEGKSMVLKFEYHGKNLNVFVVFEQECGKCFDSATGKYVGNLNDFYLKEDEDGSK